MQIHLPKDTLLGIDFRYGSDPAKHTRELESWLGDLRRSLEEYFKKIYYDMSLGTSKHRLYTTVPTTSDIGEGEIVLYESGITRRLYTKINGNVRYVGLT